MVNYYVTILTMANPTSFTTILHNIYTIRCNGMKHGANNVYHSCNWEAVKQL